MRKVLSVSDIYLNPALQMKRDTISSIFIRHDDILKAWEVLERSFYLGFRGNEAYSGYIHGHSRCGKTEVAHRFIKHLTGKRPIRGPVCQIVEGNGVRMLYVDLTNASGPLPVSMSILRLFKDVKANASLKQAQATERLILNLIQSPVDMAIFDEAQQGFRGYGLNAVQSMAEWLLPLENARVCKLAFIGSPALKRLFATVEAARERHGGIASLSPFSFKTDLQKGLLGSFLAKFAQELPFASTWITDENGCVSEDRAFIFFFCTRGYPGAIAKLCEEAATYAFVRMHGIVPDTLELSDFANAFDFLYSTDERMKGINPFRISDHKLIPSIPLCALEHDFDEERPVRAYPQRKVGGRIRE